MPALAGRALMRATALFEGAAAPPAPEILPLQHHLGRIDDPRPHHLRELALAVREALLGIGILPADVIPVVHVQRKGHHPLCGEAPARQALQPAVGRWATVAALGGVELDQGRGVGPGAGLALRSLGGSHESGKGKEEQEAHANRSKRPARSLRARKDNAECP